ncbi:hypothetical protein HYFRA_00007811 [Hymenoscyphus fraxineus]|uniref:Uncharacterized protein n=1 Tax=Hymenoscyphus fraxineus TaxID=746836 RepID=A0A9N9KM84_9HELO|nr:hypothetical protein HYFRA_00007811 [Hymenoscyphus fraxineus]
MKLPHSKFTLLLPLGFILAIISLLLSPQLKNNILQSLAQNPDITTQTTFGNDTHHVDLPADSVAPSYLEVSSSPEFQANLEREREERLEQYKKLAVSYSQRRLERQMNARKRVEKVGAAVGIFVLGVLGWLITG